jgi:hypothetical protein
MIGAALGMTTFDRRTAKAAMQRAPKKKDHPATSHGGRTVGQG